MRYLIVSDMHGNWDAFRAVLEHSRKEDTDVALVLGDLVGYGASPNEVVEAVGEMGEKTRVIRGNHDKVVAGVEDGASFNLAARSAARWTAQALSDDNLCYVRELCQGPMEIEEGVSICHGSPLDEDAYVLSHEDAYEIFQGFPAWLTFFGHTHIPSIFAFGDEGLEGGILRGESGSIQLHEDVRYLINPGSVGQPRDRDPRAAYVVYDSEMRVVTWHRLPYPIRSAQRRILEAGLPRVLAERLSLGM